MIKEISQELLPEKKRRRRNQRAVKGRQRRWASRSKPPEDISFHAPFIEPRRPPFTPSFAA
jgi:hypothetical protein